MKSLLAVLPVSCGAYRGNGNGRVSVTFITHRAMCESLSVRRTSDESRKG